MERAAPSGAARFIFGGDNEGTRRSDASPARCSALRRESICEETLAAWNEHKKVVEK